MANMSYCAFENTLDAMRQIAGILEEARADGIGFRDFLKGLSSAYERRAVEEISETCNFIYNALEEMMIQDENEDYDESMDEDFSEPDDSDYDRQTLRDAGMGMDEDY